MMDWNTFLQQLVDGRFLAELERCPPPVQRSCLPYLRLLKTSAIRDWARASRAVQHHAELAASVNSLLLERYLLHPGHRRRPVELIDF